MTGPLWHDLTHQEVWEQVHAGPGPYVSDAAAAAWRDAQAALRQIDGDLDAAITKAMGWTGTAADAARRGLTPLGGWAVDATGWAGRAAASLTEHQVQVAWVRANLPVPGPDPAIASPIPLSDAGVDPAVLQDWTVTVGRNTALADQAFHIMDTYATNTALIQQQAPTWTPPPAVTMAVADLPPPTGATSPGPAVGMSPATTAPAAAPPPAAVAAGGVAGVATGIGAAHRPGGGGGESGVGAGRVPPVAVPAIAPTALGPADPQADGRSPSTRDSSTPPIVGGVAGQTLPGAAGQRPPDDGPAAGRSLPGAPGVLRGLPDGGGPPARGGAGVLSGGASGGSGPPHETTGVLRGLPDGSAPGAGAPRAADGSALPTRGRIPGGPPDISTSPLGQGPNGVEPPLGGGANGAPGTPGRGGAPADPQSVFRGGTAATASGRPMAEGYPYLPTAGVGLGNRGETHRHPDYLTHTYAFFVDDRRLGEGVIRAEEPQPLGA